MPYTIPAVGGEGDPGFFAWATAMKNAVLDLDARVTALGGGSTFVGPLDTYAAPHRAHSVRRLLSAYTGAAIKVRRSSDNTTADVGFTSAGDLDTTALLAFAGSGSAFIDTWYDQSGNARHAAQPTTAAQPRIVNAGVLDTQTSTLGTPRAALVLDGTDDYLFSTSVGLYAAGAASLAAVYSAGPVTNSVVAAESKSSNAGAFYRMLRSSSGNINVQATNEAGTSMWASTVTGSNGFDSALHGYFYADSGSAISTWKDAAAVHAALAATRSGTLVPDRFTIGAHVGTSVANFMNGKIQELIAWGSDRTADRAAISANEKTYFGTP